MPYTMTPLRYPGGKSQFYTYLKRIIEENDVRHFKYIEPFAGGSGIAIKLLLEGLCNEIIINDIDYAIYSFWHTLLNDTRWLIDKINSTEITIDEWHKQKDIYCNNGVHNIRDVGFSVLFLNRCNRSGILTAGPIGGKKQNGFYKLDCRFNKKNLIAKIIRIAEHKTNIHILNLDAVDLIKKYRGDNNCLWFIDPPYFKKGRMLYQNAFDYKKHAQLSDAIMCNLSSHKWILTYDCCDEILKMYNCFSHKTILLTYSVGIKRKEPEYLFYNNLIV